MTAHLNSIVILVAAPNRPAALELASHLGWSGDLFAAALSAGGIAPATHYGLQAWASDAATDLLTGETSVQIDGVTPAQVDAIRATLTVDARRSSGPGRAEQEGQFEAVLAANNLALVKVELQ